MGILDRFEQRVDRLVNGLFARAFETEVEPVEVASALTSELDDRAVIIGAGRTVVPNFFVVELSTPDFERLNSIGHLLTDEFASVIREHVTEQRYVTLGDVSVQLAEDPDLMVGVFRIIAEVKDQTGAPVERIEIAATRRGAHVLINGYSHPLTRQKTVIGRAADADIPVQDTGASRHHCEIEMGATPVLRDLSSTNGTWVGQQRITEIPLTQDVDFVVGTTTIQFRAG